jgi:hypothetical protein
VVGFLSDWPRVSHEENGLLKRPAMLVALSVMVGARGEVTEMDCDLPGSWKLREDEGGREPDADDME